MINFQQYQNNKNLLNLKEDIIRIGANLPEDLVFESLVDFMENSPFAQSNWWGNLKSGWQAWRDQSNQSKQDNPVGKNYKLLTTALDGFINAVSQHPVAKQNQQLLQSLTSFKGDLSQKANELATQMSQAAQDAAVDRTKQRFGGQPSPQGQPQQGQQSPQVQPLSQQERQEYERLKAYEQKRAAMNAKRKANKAKANSNPATIPMPPNPDDEAMVGTA